MRISRPAIQVASLVALPLGMLLASPSTASALSLGRLSRLIDDFKEKPLETTLVLGGCLAVAAVWVWWKGRRSQE